MLLEVHFNGNEFIAFDKQTNQKVTDRSILEGLSFTQFPGAKGVFEINVDTTKNPVIIEPLTINIGVNNRISMPLTSRIAYTAVIDVLTMGVAQLKPEAQDHLYNIADSQRSLKIDN